MMFISIDASSGTARLVAAAGTIRSDCRRLVHVRQISGGKGGKGVRLSEVRPDPCAIFYHTIIPLFVDSLAL